LKQKTWIRWLLLLAWMALIFFFSHQDKEQSGKVSQMVLWMLQQLHIDLERVSPVRATWLVRKLAHLTIYFILYLFAFRTIRLYKPLRQSLWLGLLLIFLYAVSDEFHQTFIPGRVGLAADVGIDTLGGSLGLLLCLLLSKFRPAKPAEQSG
jgi:VanZ family protein